MTLQLLDGNELRQKYMTLSHCWGILPEDSLTTKSNLPHRQVEHLFQRVDANLPGCRPDNFPPRHQVSMDRCDMHHPGLDRRLGRGIREGGEYLPKQLSDDRS